MFGFFFGWRKASKCKRLLKRVQFRLKLLKNKRLSIVRQLREDVAQLIKIGYEDIAFNRAEQLFEDENMMAMYELLDNFCEFVLKNMSYIRRNKDCPNDVNEAVSSLIFASARFGDLPELRMIRKLFGERYGQRFETTALELLPGNLVNFQVKERMSIQSVPDDVKRSLVDDIARDYCLRAEILALEYIPEHLQEEIENNEFRASDIDVRADGSQIEEFQIQVSTANDAEGKAIYIDKASTANDAEGKAVYIDTASTRQSSTFQSQPRQSCDVISTPVSPCTAQFSSNNILDSPVLEREAEINSHVAMRSEHKSEDSALVGPTTNEFHVITASSSESLPHFPDEEIVYLDDVEEVLCSITKDGSFQDQTIFKFKSCVVPKTEKIEQSLDVKYKDQSELWSDISSLSGDSKKMKPSNRRSKRRSASLEISALKDTDSEMYYNKPCKKPPAHKHRSSCHADTRRRQTRLTQEFEQCRVKYPRHKYRRDSRGCEEVIHSHQLKNKCKNFHSFQFSGTEDSDTEMEWYTFTQQPRTIDCDLRDTKNELVRSTRFTNSVISSSIPESEGRQPYVRAITMPQERSKESRVDNVLRTRSFPVQSPSHVHPNLPDYDDIAAKFQALKEAHLRSKCNPG